MLFRSIKAVALVIRYPAAVRLYGIVRKHKMIVRRRITKTSRQERRKQFAALFQISMRLYACHMLQGEACHERSLSCPRDPAYFGDHTHPAARFTSAIHTITSNPAANVVTMINTFFKNFILVTYDRRSPA